MGQISGVWLKRPSSRLESISMSMVDPKFPTQICGQGRLGRHRKTFFGKSIQIRPRPGPLAPWPRLFWSFFWNSSHHFIDEVIPKQDAPITSLRIVGGIQGRHGVGDQDVLSDAHLPQIGRHAAIGIHLDEEDQDALQWVTLQISVSSLNNTEQPEIYGTNLQLIELQLQLLSDFFRSWASWGTKQHDLITLIPKHGNILTTLGRSRPNYTPQSPYETWVQLNKSHILFLWWHSTLTSLCLPSGNLT